MARYHLRPEDHVPARCPADAACALSPEAPHYDSRDEAFQAYEEWKKHLPASEAIPTLELPVGTLPRGTVVAGIAELAPGTYWLGDPCYAIGHLEAAWQRWVDISTAGAANSGPSLSGGTVGEWPLIAADTLYGDGSYPSSKGIAFPVDSGCIALAPKGLLDAVEADLTKLDSLGMWITVHAATVFKVSDGGTITFGDLDIFTGEEVRV